ncbi:hypothetical protein [Jiangella mangrovi]|uniref:Alpha/beta hydrolase n=1 Tax=Jiangella mangrovi TaxID=1524084 RepID=A0A7W9GU36_9ACTN|nr:hypothetical protein [Jiangella mangrovi]MBB5790039.1 hypothetical protein [Jiangella mangrovi]
MGTSARRGLVPGATALLSSALLAALVAGPSPAGAAPAPPEPAAEVASGPNWSVERAPGGYQVTVELDRPLPIRGDAPTIVVDGEPIGLATESGDGRSLTVVTADPAVAAADTVVPGWSSEAPAATTAPAPDASAATVVPDAAIAAIAADPLDPGPFDWTESIYAFGDQAIPLAAIGGIRGELEGKIYLPTTGGARPTVILLHGRHGSCYGAGEANPNRWPCAPSPDADPARLSIPSYLGYDGTARALASHGYAVVSISANAVNANDNQLAADQGAQARGQLLLDTLTMLDQATKGRRVAYYDAWTDREVTLNQALAAGSAALAARADAFPNGVDALDSVRAADLRGRFDLSHIGMMGHSRGGEGVTSATVLNQALAQPWAIESILPLAPVDFGRMTVPDVPMNVILPYCDGDVSNQQGQHMLDDSRYAFDDDVLRSGVWVMGANHNFFNTVWTPGQFSFSVSDDWGSATRRVEPTCGTDPSVAATSIRLTPAEQYDVGTAYMSAWFRLTMGGEEQFLPMFDGAGAVPSSLDGADVRSVSTAPAGSRSTLATFEEPSPAVTTVGAASAVVCASLSGRTTPQELPPCASVPSAVAPHWTPASNGGNVPATPLTRLTWAAPGDGLAVAVPAGQADASGFERLSVKLAADETVATATDLVLSVTDARGATWSAPVSELNPYALVRLPTSATDAAASTLKKIVLQQADVAVTALAAAGLDVTDLVSVGFTGTTAGAAYLSDLAFESSAVGTAQARTWRTIDVFAPNADEGDGPGTTEVAVYLDRPSPTPVTGYVSVLGSATSRFGATMQAVTFAPGETCKVVTAGRQGDDAPSTSAGTQVKASVINTSGAVMGSRSIGFTWLREDDGVLEDAVELPSYGTPGSACAELARVQAGARIGARGAVRPGSDAVVTASGFRPGETVTVTVGDLAAVDVVADASGAVAHTVAVPAVVDGRFLVLTGVGAGTGLTATGQLVVTSPGR